MDLNASPLPEDDDQTYEEPVELDFGQDDEDHVESAVEIMRRVNKIIPSGHKCFMHTHLYRWSLVSSVDCFCTSVVIIVNCKICIYNIIDGIFNSIS